MILQKEESRIDTSMFWRINEGSFISKAHVRKVQDHKKERGGQDHLRESQA